MDIFVVVSLAGCKLAGCLQPLWCHWQLPASMWASPPTVARVVVRRFALLTAYFFQRQWQLYSSIPEGTWIASSKLNNSCTALSTISQRIPVFSPRKIILPPKNFPQNKPPDTGQFSSPRMPAKNHSAWAACYVCHNKNNNNNKITMTHLTEATLQINWIDTTF